MSKEDLRARILATADPKPQAVDVPAWGRVYVKPLTVSDIESFSADVDPKLKNARSIARMLCDETGELLFDPQSADDLFAINRLPLSSTNALNAALEKMSPTSEQGAKDLGNDSPPETASS